MKRRRLVVTILVVLVVALFFARVLLGDFTYTLSDFFKILFGGNVDVPGARFILMQSKLPRAVAALVGGLVFGAVGAAMQSLMRNPLASPDVLGMSMGSSAAAVFAIIVLGWSGAIIPVVALLGGAAVAATILRISQGNIARMVLTGIAIAAGLQSLVQWILLNSSSFDALDAVVWLAGSLAQTTWSQITWMSVLGLPVVALLIILGHRVRVMELGPALAAGLGIPVRQTQRAVIGLCVVGIAAATSACGPIAFISLLAGPIAARLMRRSSIGAAALVGAAITLLGDYIGTYLVPGNGNLPVGIITGLAGAPVLAWLLVTARKKAV